MPELPEVETVVRGLRTSLAGRVITSVQVLWPRSIVPPDPDLFAHRVIGHQVTGVNRRGKWIIVRLSGTDDLLIHLRMSGRLVLESAACLDTHHLRVLFTLDDGRWLNLIDPRKFGRIWATDNPEAVLGDLGPEPLEDGFTAARLQAMLALRRGCIKSLLLDQRFLAGLGNIYTDEALWHAGLHPLRRADSLSPTEAERLHRAIQAVLQASIASGGTTLADEAFRQPDGRPGEFSDRLMVYGQAGQPCPRCRSTIERTKVGQRGTYFCPHCQVET